MGILLGILLIVVYILSTIGFICIGYDLGCRETIEAYKNKKCDKCVNWKTNKCPNTSKCFSTLDKPYFRI